MVVAIATGLAGLLLPFKFEPLSLTPDSSGKPGEANPTRPPLKGRWKKPGLRAGLAVNSRADADKKTTAGVQNQIPDS